MKMRIILMRWLLLAVFLSSCSPMGTKQQIVICASVVVDQAYDFYEEAKIELARYYNNRDANHLFKAYYAAADSMTLARSLSKCPDRKQADFFAMKNLLDLNRSIQRVVRLNMRDDDPSNLIAIYRDQYYKVIPNDIK